MRVSLIVAMAENRVIGIGNRLPWRLSRDMEHFRRTTMGHPVIMGRQTYLSIPRKFRPLSGRKTIVLTRNPQVAKEVEAEGCVSLPSLELAFFRERDSEQVFLAGGASVYRYALERNLVHEVILTEVRAAPEGDAWFPELPDPAAWVGEPIGSFPADEKNEYAAEIVRYTYRPQLAAPPPIVEPANARSPEYRTVLEDIQRTSKCPFCPGGYTLQTQEVLLVSPYWQVTYNAHPLEGSSISLLIIPRRHETEITKLSSTELKDFQDALEECCRVLRLTSYALFVRQGILYHSGATVKHLHFQLVVPNPLVRASFGHWPEEPSP
jgi:dihydrofolate reductase